MAAHVRGSSAGSKEGKALESGRVVGGLCSQKDLGRGTRGTERRFRMEVREGLDIGNLLPLSSALQKL
jgi:hypothetical protein